MNIIRNFLQGLLDLVKIVAVVSIFCLAIAAVFFPAVMVDITGSTLWMWLYGIPVSWIIYESGKETRERHARRKVLPE